MKEQSQMKKIILVLILALVASYSFFNRTPALTTSISLEEHTQDTLLLVNRDYALAHDPKNLTAIPKNIAQNVQIREHYTVQQTMLAPLKQLFAAARADGINHFTINSAYRSGRAQQQLFDNRGEAYAQPRGHSEHQTGLSLDIGSTQGTMDATAEGAWLAQHAHEYGFILRYPQGKEAITGIAYEPWHFRYVGLPHSQLMYEKNWTLEEYLENLQSTQKYTKKIADKHYFVQYTTAQKTARIPDATSVSVSQDNRGGKIITTFLN